MDEPYIVLEGSLSLKGHIFFYPAWRRKYVMVRADTRQLAIYNKKVSASSSRKQAECLIIQLKQVVECKADEPESASKKNSRFLLQKSADAGEGRKIIFRCRDPDDRERWINVINDVMNGTSKCKEFDEVVVSTSALRHYGKTRPKNPGRRLPGRVRGQTSANNDVNSVGDDADSGVGASSELLATHATLHKSDDLDNADDVIQETHTSQESEQPRTSPVKVKPLPSIPKPLPSIPKPQAPASPIKEPSTSSSPLKEKPTPPDVAKKPGKRGSLPRLKKQKKTVDGTTATDDSKAIGRGKKSSSFLSRLGARLSRSLSTGGSPSSEAPIENTVGETEEEAGKPPVVSEETAKSDDEKPVSEDVETMGIKNELRSARDTNYALSGDTKFRHDKVIQELSAIAINAKLVQQKAEALKLARMNSEDEMSGEESTSSASLSGSKSLSRRDSEKNIEQAAQNLRTTLKNLSEAELLELEKNEVEKGRGTASDREPASEDEVGEIGTVDLGGTDAMSTETDGKEDRKSTPEKNDKTTEDESLTEAVSESKKGDEKEVLQKSEKDVKGEKGDTCSKEVRSDKQDGGDPGESEQKNGVSEETSGDAHSEANKESDQGKVTEPSSNSEKQPVPEQSPETKETVSDKEEDQKD